MRSRSCLKVIYSMELDRPASQRTESRHAVKRGG
jgi:hypothetical protein